MDPLISELVQKFNALPVAEKTRLPRLGRVSNEWHFEIRFVPFEQIIGYVLALMQPQSEFMYIQRIPAGLAEGESGMAFFPETAEEAAPHIAQGILHAFINHLGIKDIASNAFSPFKLKCQEEDLARAVGQEFKRLGRGRTRQSSQNWHFPRNGVDEFARKMELSLRTDEEEIWAL